MDNEPSRAAYDMLKQITFCVLICGSYLFLSAKLEAAGELVAAFIIAVTSVIMTMIMLLHIRRFIKQSKDGDI